MSLLLQSLLLQPITGYWFTMIYDLLLMYSNVSIIRVSFRVCYGDVHKVHCF